MKLRHNKKRNTAFVYEMLISELSKASMHNLQEKKQNVLNILKSFFSKNAPLREELEIYKSFDDLNGLEEKIIERIIFEARNCAFNLDHKNIYENQTKIINLINKKLGPKSWESFIREYKKMATINQAVFSKASPKKQVFVEKKLVELLTDPEKIEKKPFPTINKLTLKTFLEKFNEQYSGELNENQKSLLNKYVTSYEDDGLELKVFLYEEIDRLKESLKKEIKNSKEPSPKFEMILEKINGYSEKKLDRKLITEVIKIQSLVSEINNAD